MASLTGLEKWSYAVGNVPFSVKEAAFANFVVFYYTQVNGLSGSLAGLAMFFALTWDAISDPVVGSWSDNFRSRWAVVTRCWWPGHCLQRCYFCRSLRRPKA